MTAPRNSTRSVSISIHAAGHFVALVGDKEIGSGPICLLIEGRSGSPLEKLMMRIQPLPPPPPPPPGWEFQLGEGCILNWINQDGHSKQLKGPLICNLRPMGPITIGSPEHHWGPGLEMTQLPR